MRRLAFIDLDLTLFDYTTIRRKATCTALQAMGFKQPTMALRYIDSVLIEYGDILVELGFPNFRRAWNTRELFAIAILMNRNSRSHELLKILQQIQLWVPNTEQYTINRRQSSFLTRWERRRLLLTGARDNSIGRLPQEVSDLFEDDKSRRIIDNAVIVFNEYIRKNMHEYSGAKEVADKFDESGFEFYVVSEGDPKVQKEKLSLLPTGSRALGSFVSGECSLSEELLEQLWNIAISREDRFKNTITGDRIFSALSILYDKVFEYSIKTPTFFRKVLQTLLLPLEKQTEFFLKLGWLSHADVKASESVSLIIIGDRYEKDLLPAIQAFGAVTTIRLHLGKYRETYSIEALKNLGLPKPTANVRSLREIIRIVSALGELPLIPTEKIDMLYNGLHPRVEIDSMINVLHEKVPGIPKGLLESLNGLRSTKQ
jgi:hypothetical protein